MEYFSENGVWLVLLIVGFWLFYSGSKTSNPKNSQGSPQGREKYSLWYELQKESYLREMEEFREDHGRPMDEIDFQIMETRRKLSRPTDRDQG